MTQIPEDNFAQPWGVGHRPEVPRTGTEREQLATMLDWHRATFELKCADVPVARLSERVIPRSALTLHGLLRHLAAVERWWFRQQFAGEDVPSLYYSDDDPDQDFDALGGDVDEVFAVWHDECERSRQVVAAAASLDDLGVAVARGGPISLRWVMLQMVAEYARHNGHADLLREQIDGATGY